jgi:hypothetical protein
MNDTILLHPEDAWIDRDGDGINQGMAILRDEEGAEMGRFLAGWTDNEIMMALHLANKFYAKGVEMGKWYKVCEIKAALDIKEPQ